LVAEAGATIVECEPTMASREATLAETVARTGATVVPPFDHADVVNGQGTLGLEIVAEWPEVDVIVAPIGGGGMVGGVAVAAKGRKPGVRVIAAEPEVADDAARSKRSGVRQAPTNAPTLADGLRAGIGAVTLPLLQEFVDEVISVSEDDIARWMRFAFERLKLVIEPSAAVGVAAIRSPAFKALAGQAGWRNAALVICGGNCDLDRLPWLH
ncbi:MAG: pyridoxal-phosphate dependent enzyme, partial [Planctomycetota bacterium]